MIVAGIVAFNEEGLIGEAIRSVLAYVDQVIVLDVAFPSNPQEGVNSTDGTKRVATKIGGAKLAYLQESERLSEVDARNGILTLLKPKDYLLVIDADEILVGDHESIEDLMHWVNSGKVFDGAIGLQVYTRNILFGGQAPEISEEEYATLPVVSSVGIQPRLFPVRDHQYRLIPPDLTPALHWRGQWVGTGTLASECFLVNQRTRQSFEAYQNDYAWQMGR